MPESTRSASVEGSRAERSWLSAPVRMAVATILSIAVAELVAMAILEVVRPRPFWPAALLDATIMVAIIFPFLRALVIGPLTHLAGALRRSRDEARRQKREIEALYAVTAAGAREPDVDRILPEVVEVVTRHFSADGGWALRNDEETNGPRVVGARGVSPSLLTPETLSFVSNCPFCEDCFRERPSPTEARSIARCRRLPKEILEAEGIRQHLAVPLSDGERFRVTLNLVWRTSRELDDGEKALLVALGRQAGTAVGNAAHHRAEQNARKAADTLASAGLAVARSLALEEVLGTLLEHVRRLVPYDRAKVMLRDGDTRLRVRAVEHGERGIDFGEPPDATFDVDANGTVREVLESGKALYIPDTLAHSAWSPKMKPGFERSWLGVPLLSGGRAIGLFTLVTAEPNGFSPEHARLAEALSVPASTAIANARLFEELGLSRDRLQSLSRQLVDVQERERLRVSRELHDEAGQLLSSLTVGLRLLEGDVARPEAVLSRVAELRQVVDSVQEGLHRLASDLRPAVLDHLGLLPALGQLTAKLSSSEGPAVHFETVGFGGGRLSFDMETALYRIAQEALTNAVRHSGARQVSVVVERRRSRIVMVVEDDGRGFEAGSASRPGHHGLDGLRERAEMLGGTVLVETSPGSGTTIVAEIPCAA